MTIEIKRRQGVGGEIGLILVVVVWEMIEIMSSHIVIIIAVVVVTSIEVVGNMKQKEQENKWFGS